MLPISAPELEWGGYIQLELKVTEGTTVMEEILQVPKSSCSTDFNHCWLVAPSPHLVKPRLNHTGEESQLCPGLQPEYITSGGQKEDDGEAVMTMRSAPNKNNNKNSIWATTLNMCNTHIRIPPQLHCILYNHKYFYLHCAEFFRNADLYILWIYSSILFSIYHFIFGKFVHCQLCGLCVCMCLPVCEACFKS